MSPKMTRHRNAFSRAPAKSVISLRRNSCSIPDPLAADDSELRPLRPETSPRRWFGKISDNSNLPMEAAAPREIGPVWTHSAHPFYGADPHIDQIDPGVSKAKAREPSSGMRRRWSLAVHLNNCQFRVINLNVIQWRRSARGELYVDLPHSFDLRAGRRF